MMGLGTFYPGGGIEEHYHVYADDVPIFDHAYYVISGKIKAVIGDQVRIVGTTVCSTARPTSNTPSPMSAKPGQSTAGQRLQRSRQNG